MPYANLIVTKPSPIVLEQILTEDSDSAPLFPNIDSDSDGPIQVSEFLHTKN